MSLGDCARHRMIDCLVRLRKNMGVEYTSVLMILSFLCGAILVVRPVMPEKADLLRWAPFVTMLLVILIEAKSAFSADRSYPRVAKVLADGAPFADRIGVLISDWQGAVSFIMLGFALMMALAMNRKSFTNLLLTRGFTPNASLQIQNTIWRWAGIAWSLGVLGLFPDQAFSSTGPIPEQPTISAPSGADAIGAIFCLMAIGWACGLVLLLMVRHSSSEPARAPSEEEWGLMHPLSGLMVWLPVMVLLLLPSFTDLELVVDSHLRSPVSMSLAIAALAPTSGLILHTIQESDASAGPGENRALRLGIVFAASLMLVSISTWYLLGEVDRVGSGWGRISVTLWLVCGVLICALIGTIMPMFGFDQRAQPELWGWRTGFLISPVFIALFSDLAIVVIPGIWLACLASMPSTKASPYAAIIAVCLLYFASSMGDPLTMALAICWLPFILIRISLFDKGTNPHARVS